ncbi:hypothetical protein SK803_34385 [Lentzea sp. BCCO 10_0856]|uniref:Uncharacterized protein n=1 Tax=Lentzea miocenica TaxID=3095431 RepID=A0ABU4TAX6_9PSEU|nr:hypothetical protein [Lentzea sp. BCCO 10_0856]MDX8035326.1 hypothetical protein [Lentzea sp. BCCO 10_0856]
MLTGGAGDAGEHQDKHAHLVDVDFAWLLSWFTEHGPRSNDSDE